MRLDAFLKLEAQDGESTDALHDKEIEILSFEQTTSRFRSENDGNWLFNASVVTILKPLDASSPKLLDAVTLSGKVYKTATISACRMTGLSKDKPEKWKKIDYFVIELEDVYISSVQLLGDARVRSIGGDEVHRYYPDDLTAIGPLEQVELGFKKMKWNYKGEDGTKQFVSLPIPKK